MSNSGRAFNKNCKFLLLNIKIFHTWNSLMVCTICLAGFVFKHSLISLEFPVGQPTKSAIFAVFSLAFSIKTHEFRTHPLWEIPCLKSPKNILVLKIC